jgi:hypothetical protein
VPDGIYIANVEVTCEVLYNILIEFAMPTKEISQSEYISVKPQAFPVLNAFETKCFVTISF